MTAEKYWICDECAKERGGTPFKTGNTVIIETCGYCNGQKQTGKYITPVVDFIWNSVDPKRKRSDGNNGV